MLKRQERESWEAGERKARARAAAGERGEGELRSGKIGWGGERKGDLGSDTEDQERGLPGFCAVLCMIFYRERKEERQ